jgi:heme-degrading monooxygenase HmoA
VDIGRKEIAMFIAMNRFRVKRGSEADFEAVWLNRQSYIAKEPGFVEFHVLRELTVYCLGVGQTK